MRALLAVCGVVVAAVVLHGEDARACSYSIRIPEAGGGLADQGRVQTVAPPGGLWWLVAEDPDDEVLVIDGGGGDAVAEVVTRGPTRVAVRVPATAQDGDTFRITVGDSSHDVTVSGEALEPTPAPVLGELIAIIDDFVVDERPCDFNPGFRETIQSARIEAATTPTPGAGGEDLLLDAWLLRADEELPDELAPRVLDAFPIVGSLKEEGFSVATGALEGDWVFFARLRDPHTGAVSEMRSRSFTLERAKSAGCGCSSSSPGDAAVALVLVGLLRRRRR